MLYAVTLATQNAQWQWPDTVYVLDCLTNPSQRAAMIQVRYRIRPMLTLALELSSAMCKSGVSEWRHEFSATRCISLARRTSNVEPWRLLASILIVRAQLREAKVQK